MKRQTLKHWALGAGLAICMGVQAPVAAAADAAYGDDDASAAAMAFDLTVVRPVALATTAVGCALFVVALPLNLIQQSSPRKNAETLCVEPGKYAVMRPLGKGE